MERCEVSRVGQQMATERCLTYTPCNAGGHIRRRLAGVANLIERTFPNDRERLGFKLVPW
jgi:hypothetical protein